MNTKKGFTLIELLVVIAIIGMMSSIVLASLNSARAKASDASIKQDLVNLRPQAGIYYDTNGNYGASQNCNVTETSITDDGGSFCSGILADATFARGLKAAVATNGGSPGLANVDQTTSAWAVSVPLKSSATTYWCVDSSGASKQEGSSLGSAVVCP